MALRKGHGKGRGQPRIEVLPADELPPGIPAPDGFQLSRRARAKQRKRLSAIMGPGGAGVADHQNVAPYRALAEQLQRDEVERLALEVGGGVCTVGVESLVTFWARQASSAAWARAMAEEATAGGDQRLAAYLASQAKAQEDSARQNRLAAHELCFREASARQREEPEPGLAELLGEETSAA